jgi:hypothetical protein
MVVWSPAEILGVSREVVEHTLNIKPGLRPIMQGLQSFNMEKRLAMGEELSRLLDSQSSSRTKKEWEMTDVC